MMIQIFFALLLDKEISTVMKTILILLLGTFLYYQLIHAAPENHELKDLEEQNESDMADNLLPIDEKYNEEKNEAYPGRRRRRWGWRRRRRRNDRRRIVYIGG